MAVRICAGGAGRPGVPTAIDPPETCRFPVPARVPPSHLPGRVAFGWSLACGGRTPHPELSRASPARRRRGAVSRPTTCNAHRPARRAGLGCPPLGIPESPYQLRPRTPARLPPCLCRSIRCHDAGRDASTRRLPRPHACASSHQVAGNARNTWCPKACARSAHRKSSSDHSGRRFAEGNRAGCRRCFGSGFASRTRPNSHSSICRSFQVSIAARRTGARQESEDLPSGVLSET